MDIFFVVHNHLRCMFNCRGTATEKKVPFREQYGKIGECRCFLPAAQFIAMTATASKKTEKSICENLQIREHASIRMSCNRNNIRFVMSMPYITSSCLLRNFAIFYHTYVGLLLYWFSTAVFHKMLCFNYKMDDRLNSVLGSQSDNIGSLLSWYHSMTLAWLLMTDASHLVLTLISFELRNFATQPYPLPNPYPALL